jgi:hypothetical protein
MPSFRPCEARWHFRTDSSESVDVPPMSRNVASMSLDIQKMALSLLRNNRVPKADKSPQTRAAQLKGQCYHEPIGKIYDRRSRRAGSLEAIRKGISASRARKCDVASHSTNLTRMVASSSRQER